jgi:translation initiation factor IF-2
MKITELAQQLNTSEYELRKIIQRCGFHLQKNDKKIKGAWIKRIKETMEEERRSKKEDTKDIGKGQSVSIPEIVQVRELAEVLGVTSAVVIKELIRNGIMASLNEEIDYDTAAIITEDLGFKPSLKKIDEKCDILTGEKLDLLLSKEDSQKLKARPPVVAILGHVDHGKTTLLDKIREAHVAEGEAGGITQHIGAYQATLKKGKNKGRSITFLDTPGHEAFASMRQRGANITDIAILVVAADDGVQPQTIESIKHAKNAHLPIVVAINKIDKPEANPDKIKKELSEHDVLTEEWGGDTVCATISAKSGKGIDELLDMVLLVADLDGAKANPERPAIGTVIEADLDKRRGPLATLLVQAGTLKVGDWIAVGGTCGKVRSMEDFQKKSLKTALPSTPVRISGISEVPQAGDIFQVVAQKKAAKSKIEQFIKDKKAHKRGSFGAVDMKRFTKSIESEKVTKLNLVLKADVRGSLEAILQTLETLKSEEVAVKIVSSGVGNINASDIIAAQAAHGIVVGFNVNFSSEIQKMAEEEKVPVKIYTIIYELIEDIREKLIDLLPCEIIKVPLGKMKIIAVFKQGKHDMIVGGKVLSGSIKPKSKVNVLRKKEKIATGDVAQVQIEKKTVEEAKEGLECGILYKGRPVIQEGDFLECFMEKEEKRKF